MQSIELPSNLTSLGIGAFEGCEALKEVTLGSSLQEIKSTTFAYCSELKSIVIPNSVVSIESHAFENSGLDSVFISKTVNEIGIYNLSDDIKRVSPFIGCRKLKSIIVDESNPIYDSRDNCNAIIETEKNLLLFGCSGTQIPNSVTTIGQGAFMDMGIKSITIPGSVESIENSAFRNNPSLVEIHCQGTIPPSCNSYSAFDNESLVNCILYVPIGCKQVYESSGWSWFSHIVEEDPAFLTAITTDTPHTSTIYTVDGIPTATPTQGTITIHSIHEGSTRKQIIR